MVGVTPTKSNTASTPWPLVASWIRSAWPSPPATGTPPNCSTAFIASSFMSVTRIVAPESAASIWTAM